MDKILLVSRQPICYILMFMNTKVINNQMNLFIVLTIRTINFFKKIYTFVIGVAFQSIRHRISLDVKKVSTLEELLVVCPDFAEVVTDATEQQRRRPKKRIQKKYYSGKKKRHTIKTQITVNTKGKILMVSKSYPGRIHDYTIFKQENTAKKLPTKSVHYGDSGYDGAPNDYPEHTIIIPVKRRRNHSTLSLSEKRFNRKHSRIRILFEHVLSRMKKYQILAKVYRHKMIDYNRRFRNIAALINFRLASSAI